MSIDTSPDTIALQPWFPEGIAQLGLKRGARVIMLTASTPDLCSAVLEAIGKDGHLTVLEPDAERAARADQLEHKGLAVISYRPDGGESFGRHDAMIACPATDPGWPLNRYGEFACQNLRPGGRFVVDLPGERHCEPISSAWKEISGPAQTITPWHGPSDASLAQLMRGDGLREIEPRVATYVVEFATAHDAAAVACARLGAPGDVLAGLQLALARRFETHEALDLLFRRTRVTGMR